MISPPPSGRKRNVKRLALEFSLTTKGNDLPSIKRDVGSTLMNAPLF